MNLAELEKSYLSKSKDQKITQIHIISDFVTFEDDVSTPELIIDGQINGIKLETFQKTILLNRTQLFEDMVYFENIAVRSKLEKYNNVYGFLEIHFLASVYIARNLVDFYNSCGVYFSQYLQKYNDSIE